MNIKAIKAAQAQNTALALCTDWSVRRETLGCQARLRPAEILETRPKDDPRFRYGDKATVRVRLTDSGSERWVEPRFLLATWKEYEDARREYVERVKRAQRARLAAEARDAAACAELEALLRRFNINKTARVHVGTAFVRMTLAECKALIAATASDASCAQS